MPWGIIIGGEELHNNHHAYGTSAKLSSRWYEFDIGWMYIRILEMLGFATVRKVAPQLKFDRAKAVPDLATLQAIITHRYAVATSYAASLKAACAAEIAALRAQRPQRAHDCRACAASSGGCPPTSTSLTESERARACAGAGQQQGAPADLPHAPGAGRAVEPVDRVVASSCSRDCRTGAIAPRHRGIAPLAQFSLQLKRYA